MVSDLPRIAWPELKTNRHRSMNCNLLRSDGAQPTVHDYLAAANDCGAEAIRAWIKGDRAEENRLTKLRLRYERIARVIQMQIDRGLRTA